MVQCHAMEGAGTLKLGCLNFFVLFVGLLK